MIKLAVSPGDPAGIGPDICIKAFGQNKNLNFTPVIFGDVDLFQERAQNLEVDVQVKEFKGQDKDLRLLSYQLMVDNFNKRYKTLNTPQKNLLKDLHSLLKELLKA